MLEQYRRDQNVYKSDLISEIVAHAEAGGVMPPFQCGIYCKYVADFDKCEDCSIERLRLATSIVNHLTFYYKNIDLLSIMKWLRDHPVK
jgi:hypothetical protein